MFRAKSPRLRKDWDSLARQDGKVTADELLWVVIITMGVAGLRERVLKSGDLVEYALHFFVIWGVYSSAIYYSGRFNDYDRIHGELWAVFLLALLFMVAALNHSIVIFGVCAGSAHLILALAYIRVALRLERARCYAAYFCLVEFFNGLLLVSLVSNTSIQILWINVFFESFFQGLHKFIVYRVDTLYGEEFGRLKLDVPGDFDYIIARYESSHMMILVCSFLFPLAIQGNAFLHSRSAAICIILGFLYALIAKLCFFDSKEHEASAPISIRHVCKSHWIHPLRRSRLSSRLFHMSIPLSVFGFALTGVGFIAAVQALASDNDQAKSVARRALAIGPCLSWCVLFLTMALGGPFNRFFLDSGTPAKLLLSTSFLFNLGLSQVFHNCIFTIGIQLLIFFLHIWIGNRRLSQESRSITRATDENSTLVVPSSQIPTENDDTLPFYASWRQPRLLKDWSRLDARLGDRVSSHEHFFTVLVAVACWILNNNLQDHRDIVLYCIQFVYIWAGLAMTMRYAARFNDDDGAHAVIWSLYQLLLLCLLEGLSASSTFQHFKLSNLFQIAAIALFGFLAVGFWLRIVIFLPRARPFALALAAVCFIHSGISALAGSFSELRGILLVLFCVIALSTDALLVCGMRLTHGNSLEMLHQFDLPLNIEYVIARYGGLQMEILGVAVIVPNAYFPTAYPHPPLVAAGVACAGLTAVFIKILLFDADATAPERHAVRQSQGRALLFFTLSPITLFSISLLGGAFSLLLPRAGSQAGEHRARLLFGASSILFASLTATKLSHAAQQYRAHCVKAILTAIGCLATLAPILFLDLDDNSISGLIPVVWTTLVCFFVSFSQLAVNAAFFVDPATCM